MSIKQKAVKGVVWSAIQNWGSQAGSLIVFFILARLLEPEDFGLVALANVFLAFMQIFLEQGFAQALIQRREIEPEHLNTAFWTNLVIGILLTVLGLTSAGLVANLFKQPQLTPILRCFSGLFVISSFAKVQQALLEREFDFRAIALRWLLGTLIGGIVGVVMAVNGFGVWSLVSQQMVHELVGTLVLWGASPWRPQLKFSVEHFHSLFGFGINILGFNLISFFNNRVNDFLIGYFLGPVALGYYTIAYRVLTVMTQLLVRTSQSVALPTFSRLQADLKRFRKVFYTATQLTSLIAFPTFLGMATLAPELIRLLFGNQWVPAIPIVQVLALMGILRSVTFFAGSVFMAMGKPSWWFWLGSLKVILNFVGFAIAYRWGIIAVTIAYVLRLYIAFPIGQWAISRLIHVPLLTYLRQFVAPLVSSLIMAAVILVVKQAFTSSVNSLALLIICTVIGGIIYGITIRLFAPKLWQLLLELLQLAWSRSKPQNP